MKIVLYRCITGVGVCHPLHSGVKVTISPRVGRNLLQCYIFGLLEHTCMATFPKLVIRQGFWGKRTWHISKQLLSRHFFLHWGNQQRLSVCIDCNRPRQNLVYAVHKSKRGFCYKRPVILDTTEPLHIWLLSTPQVRKSETGFSPPGLRVQSFPGAHVRSVHKVTMEQVFVRVPSVWPAYQHSTIVQQSHIYPRGV